MLDSRFYVKVLSQTFEPQRMIWLAMHQDYYEGSVADVQAPSELDAGALVVKHLLNGERGHYGPLEHPQISLSVTGFPHSVMQQARTHRVGVSFDVQSMRYTGQRIYKYFFENGIDIEDLFYFRPVGSYRSRGGRKYAYSETMRKTDIEIAKHLSKVYAYKLQDGHAEEHARDMLPFNFRQNFVVSFNLRSALHFLDLRSKLDAQKEIVELCELILPCLESWAPQVMDYYVQKRLGKARLAP
jgi:thymidylate synthase (FAD)